MKKSRILAFAVWLSLGLAVPAGVARAQAAAAAAAATAASPVIHVIRHVIARPKPSGDWLKARVIHFDSHSLIVREADNERMIHTFTYATALEPKMQALMDKGGYQYGDQVNILHAPGQMVALKIRGKPSKPQ